MNEEKEYSQEVQKMSRDIYKLKIRAFLSSLSHLATALSILCILALIQDKKSLRIEREIRVSLGSKPKEEEQDGSVQENSGDSTKKKYYQEISKVLETLSNIQESDINRPSDQLE